MKRSVKIATGATAALAVSGLSLTAYFYDEGSKTGIEPHGEKKPHSPELLTACPNLKEGEVKTTTIANYLRFAPQYWRTTNQLEMAIDEEQARNIRNNLRSPDADGEPEAGDLLLINSWGGNVANSHSIIDTMNVMSGNTATLCANQISSAAMTVFAAGHNRYAYPSCYGVAHGTSYDTLAASDKIEYGAESTHEKTERHRFLHNADIVDRHYMTKSGLMDDTCYNFLSDPKNGDTYLHGDDFLNLGIADAILISKDEMIVRADDWRVNFQACTDIAYEEYTLRLELPENLSQQEYEEVITLVEAEYNEAYSQCALNHTPS